MAYNIENLTKLRDFIATLSPVNFDHSVWQSYSDYTEEKTPLVVEEKNVCGTAACIAGWGAIIGNLIEYTVNGDNFIVRNNSFSFNYPREVGKWLGILDEHEREAIFTPWDAIYRVMSNYEDLPDFEDMSENDKNLYVATDEIATTPEDAAAFLTRIIEENTVDVRWWYDIKKDRVDEWNKENAD
jgi:hypothetical protein